MLPIGSARLPAAPFDRTLTYSRVSVTSHIILFLLAMSLYVKVSLPVFDVNVGFISSDLSAAADPESTSSVRAAAAAIAILVKRFIVRLLLIGPAARDV